MADFNDEPLKFGIEQTMEYGDMTLLDSIDADPKDVEDLNPVEKKLEKKPAPKTNEKKDEEEDGKDDDPPSNESIVASFLEDDEDEDENLPAPPNKTEEDDNDEKNVPSTQFEALAKDLIKLGVFTEDEDDEDLPPVKTAEDFLERFNAEKKKGAIEIVNNFTSQLGEDYQHAFDAIFVKGVDPKLYFGIYNNVVSFAEMDLTKETNQEAVVRRTLSEQGFEAEDVDAEVEKLKNYGDLESVATRYHKVLVKKEAAKLKEAEEKSQRELEAKVAIKKQFQQDVFALLQEKLKTKEFDGIPLNPKLATELQDFLLVDRWKTASGETLTDFDKKLLELKKPENHQMKVKLALLLKLLEKDPTLSTIQKSVVTKKTDKLFEEVNRLSPSKGKNSQSSGKDVFASLL